MSSDTWKLKPRQVEERVKALLAAPSLDMETLSELAGNWHFGGLTLTWAPVLWRRDPVSYRPFILAHMSSHAGFKPIKWTGELSAWLAEVDARDDIELFQRLWHWKINDQVGWRSEKANALFNQELRRRLENLGQARWRLELRKLDVWFQLDEETALVLFEKDPVAAGPFLLKHLPWSLFKPIFWDRVFTLAYKRDPDFAFKLYRRQVPAARWESDVADLARTVADPKQLLSELEKRHPEGLRRDPGGGMYRLLELRGRDVLPYVMRHLVDVWTPWLGKGQYGKLLALAERQGWMDLWAALVRTVSTATDFNAAIRKLVKERRLEDLLAVAGVGRELNFGPIGLARTIQLDEATAVALYEEYPALVRTAYRAHLQVHPWSAKPVYERLVDRALALNDEELLDFLASRFLAVGRATGEVARLYEYYRGCPDFARRAASVLTRIPAYTLGWRYAMLMKENPLARLFFERSAASYLDSPEAVADLVEGSDIYVQALAYRVLGLDDPRARELGRRHLSLLLATLLRPLHRATRMLAFAALANVGLSSLEVAVQVHQRARAALHLPDVRYPREKLVGLIGQLLHRWPELRSEAEQPVVYR